MQDTELLEYLRKEERILMLHEPIKWKIKQFNKAFIESQEYYRNKKYVL